MCSRGLAPKIKCVISNKKNAPGLEIARQFNIPSYVIEHQNFANREEFDQNVAKIIDSVSPQYIILAGFMRILSTWFVNHYKNRLINIHPSLLPAFIGANAIDQAFMAKVKIAGVTIHFVTEKLDSGPIIAQAITGILNTDTLETLSTKIHQLEHILYPFIIEKLLNNEINIDHNDMVVSMQTAKDSSQLGIHAKNIFY
jgi:phosphoribosylglycinamide formyltransferase-1